MEKFIFWVVQQLLLQQHGLEVLSDIYDVNTDVWSVGTSFGAASSERSAVNVGGVIYNSGGRSGAAAVALTHDGYIISAKCANRCRSG
ncbi:MAG: hypothetical protein IPK08_19890 [Bacteroidetes bacterium]|nr:hypothetical protein [Bacteroidota bacterium]